MALLLEEIGWPDVEEYLRHDNRLILVVGSTEQHGRHLTFATDVWQPWEIARRVSDQTGVLVAPPVSYGMSLHHLGFPGSLSLRPQTLSSIIADLLESAYGHGFRRILILNGHGGNIAAIQVALAEVLNELPGLKVRLESWWQAPEVRALFAAAFDVPGGHADAGETSAILAIRPDVVRLDRAACTPDAPYPDFLTVETFLECFPHGVIGADPKLGSAQVGEEALQASVQVCVRWLER
ncbi:MAG: creatininase family protein [Anaerolineae bacterium]|nr:creatininase family protein [Anaerolineae bacterium]